MTAGRCERVWVLSLNEGTSPALLSEEDVVVQLFQD